MANASLKAPLSSSQEQIRRELLPKEWSAALVLDYLSKSEYGGELTNRTLAIGQATYDLQVSVEGLLLDVDLIQDTLADHINATTAHGATGRIVGQLDYCTATTGGVVLQAAAQADATANTTTPPAALGAAGAAYSQAYAQQQTDAINMLITNVSDLKTTVNALVTVVNNILATERTAKQRAL